MLPRSAVPVLLLGLLWRWEDASLLLLHVAPNMDSISRRAHVRIDPVHACRGGGVMGRKG